jgi:hypothetical protein
MRFALNHPLALELGGTEEPSGTSVAELGAEGRAYSRREFDDAARAAQGVGIEPYGPEPGEVGSSAREVDLGS